MAKPKTKASKSEEPAAQADPVDAISLLKADHREVDALFDEFDKARRSDTKERLVAEICTALKIHTLIEEEIFYPAVRSKIDPDIVDEGVVEHDGAKVLINDLSAAKPTDPFYDSKVKVLSEDIRHHVSEEEGWLRGMFAQARRTDIDMEALGAKLAARKAELKEQAAKKKLPSAKLAAVKIKS